tara:strand:- start:404 stop:547 length:144 start_codon:yes stop_codon:yes gene_type:complete
MNQPIRYHARQAARLAQSDDPEIRAWARWHEQKMRQLKQSQEQSGAA